MTTETRGSEPTLSPAGKQRREQILQSALERVASRRRRRTGTRWALWSVVLVGVLGWALRAQAPTPAGELSAKTFGPDRQLERLRALTSVDADVIQTLPGLAKRAALPQEPLPSETFLSDDELLALLEGAGVSAGVIRVEGETRVMLNGDQAIRLHSSPTP